MKSIITPILKQLITLHLMGDEPAGMHFDLLFRIKKMKKNIVIIFWLLVSSAAHAQENRDISNIILTEAKKFIDTVKPGSIMSGRYSIYIIDFKKLENCPCNIFFTMSYISNEVDLERIHFNYYFLMKNEIILVNTDNSTKSIISDLNLNKITDSNISLIQNKLFDKKDGWISGTPEGELFCLQDGILHKRFYKNSDEIPDDFSVFDRSFLDSIIIRKIPHPELPPDHPSNRSPYFPLNGR